jgi:nitrate/nitrite transport system substrate-binding protein
VAKRHSPAAHPFHGGFEVTLLTVSFLPLTDAAPFLVAQAKGLFKQHGVEVALRRESSWTALRDALNKGTSQAAQIRFGMPAAAACGLLGDKQKPLVVPWILSRNGQAITLSNRHRGVVTSDSSALLALARERRDAGRPLVFGHTLRVGTHAMWLRYWLAAGGIHPDEDVALITVPPPQMVGNMKTRSVDGFCVGEPWNARAISEGLGYTAVTSQEIWPDHPEKVCAFSGEFAEENPDTVVATLKSLHQAGLWLDDEANHDEAATLLAQPDFLNCDAAWIRCRLGPKVDYGDGRTRSLDHSLVFAKDGVNRPSPGYAVWFLTQLRRWGLHYGTPDYSGVSTRVMRPDIYERVVAELGLTDTEPTDPKEAFFDGKVFDPSDPEGYATGFTLKTLLG